jgi:hypothetical protein
MSSINSREVNNIRLIIFSLIFSFTINVLVSCGTNADGKKSPSSAGKPVPPTENITPEPYNSVNTLIVLPKNPAPGQPFRILVTGDKNIGKAQIVLNGPTGSIDSRRSKEGGEMPYWRIDDFNGIPEGKYNVRLIADKKEVINFEFGISARQQPKGGGVIWKSVRGWDSGMEALYSAWINALFSGYDDNSSWKALHEVTQNPDHNFLFDYLSLGEDDAAGNNKLIMQPDCADNPFYLRAYFAWKLGLPFGFHICDRGSLSHNPRTGQWITNEISTSKTNPVTAFNAFLRMVMNGVQSGTARTGLDDESSDYYPVPLEQGTLRPGTVFADPYGHTLVIVGRTPQTNGHPGLLLSVDAQPDGTVGIKRFWKGNFLFNTSGVIGEPGFKAFRPIELNKGVAHPVMNKSLKASSGFVPFSMQQEKMKSEVFYHTMDRLINPKPLDPEAALLDLIDALHEQLTVRVTSVANGEAYFRSHPGTVIPMPSSAAGIFQAGGQWEDFSTPNRDLRLLIAMDLILDFPDRVVSSPGDFDMPALSSPEQVRKKLQSLLDRKVSDLSISYTRTDGSVQKLTLEEILKRRDAFEMAYNPNDGIEIRWGAPEKSEERSTCRRHSPARQLETMNQVRNWFHKRLHPPT